MKKYLYIHVKLYDFENNWDFRYLSDEDIYNVGDYVWVNLDGEELPMIVTDKVWYDEDEVPWPLNKMKKIIRKSSREEYLKNNEWCILNYILSRLDKNSNLPDDFSLDKFRKGKLKFVDGAMDGICAFHSEFEGDEELTKKIFDIIRKHDEDYIKVVKEFDKLLQDRIIRSNLNDISQYEFEHFEELSPKYLFTLACTMIYKSKNPETIKLATALLYSFRFEEIDKDLYHIFNKLALCEEFTECVSTYIFPHYKDCEKLRFKTAKKVRGWGRIFLIYSMAFSNKEEKKWLLKEGYMNNIDDGYTAVHILPILDTKNIILSGNKEDFYNISEIINVAILNGPGPLIDYLDNYKEIFDTYLSVKDSHKGDYNYYATVKNMYYFEEGKYKEALDILDSKDCYNTIKNTILKGTRAQAFNVIDICNSSKKYDYSSVVLERFNKDIIENGFCLCYLLNNEKFKDKIIDRLNKGSDLVDGYEVNNMSYMDFLRELKNHPLVGLPYVEAALKWPDKDVKEQAIWLINYWNEDGAKIPKDLKKYIKN